MTEISPLFLQDYLRGALLAAFLFFLLIPLVTFPGIIRTLVTSVGWRRWTSGALGSVLALVLVLIYRDWFGSTFYRIDSTAVETSIRLGLTLPERTVILSAGQIKSVRRIAGPRGLGKIVVIETTSGREFVSPSLSSAQAEVVEAIARSAKTNRLHGVIEND